MKSKIYVLIALALFVFLGTCFEKVNTCAPIFRISKNLYIIKAEVNKKSLEILNEGHYNNEIINGDW